ncbi:MAG: hypothetical protein JWP80_4868 [Pseudomonas sp.]|nr:hypothetical protein [Pseudomonas sp.]
MDEMPEGSQTDPIEEQLSEFSTEMILAAKTHDELAKDRHFHIRWYNGLPADTQGEVRDKIRAEILRIRSEFGKRTEPLYPLPVKRSEQG